MLLPSFHSTFDKVTGTATSKVIICQSSISTFVRYRDKSAPHALKNVKMNISFLEPGNGLNLDG